MTFQPKFRPAFWPGENPYKEKKEVKQDTKKLTIYKREIIEEKVEDHGVGLKESE